MSRRIAGVNKMGSRRRGVGGNGLSPFDDSGPSVPDPPANVFFDLQSGVFNSNAGTTQDFDASAFTADPKGVIFAHAKTAVSGTITSDGAYSIGFGDGTSDGCLSGISDDALATSNTWNHRSISKSIISPNIGGSPESEGSAVFYTGTPRGSRVTWASSGASADWLGAILQMAGSNVSVKQLEVAPSLSTNASVGITGVGFAPDVVIGLGTRHLVATGTMSSDNIASFGAAVRGGSQASAYCRSVTTQATTLNRCLTTNNRFIDGLTSTPARRGLEVTAWGADGIDVTARGGSYAGYTETLLFLKLASNADAEVSQIALPTSTGSTKFTTGFYPRIVLMAGSGSTNLVTIEQQDAAFFLSMIGVDSQHCTAFFDEDGVTTSNTESVQTNKALLIPDGSGAALWEASLSSVASDGFTLNFTTVESTARKAIVLALR